MKRGLFLLALLGCSAPPPREKVYERPIDEAIADGASFLVASQNPDGSWFAHHEGKEKGTAFGLLFLTRATSPVKAVRRGGNGWLETHTLNDASNFMIILDASGSMRDEIDGKEKFEIAKERRLERIKKVAEKRAAKKALVGSSAS